MTSNIAIDTPALNSVEQNSSDVRIATRAVKLSQQRKERVEAYSSEVFLKGLYTDWVFSKLNLQHYR